MVNLNKICAKKKKKKPVPEGAMQKKSGAGGGKAGKIHDQGDDDDDDDPFEADEDADGEMVISDFGDNSVGNEDLNEAD